MRRRSVVAAMGLVVVAASAAAGCRSAGTGSQQVQAGAPPTERPSTAGPTLAAVRARGTIHAEERQFSIVDDGAHPGAAVEPSDGPVDPATEAGSGAIVLTGIAMGEVWVSVEARGEAPPGVETVDWEEVVEVSVRARGRLHVAGPGPGPPVLPVLNPTGAGEHRLRIHARGRYHNPDGVDDEPFEEYLLVTWPAPPAPQIVHKQTGSPASEPLILPPPGPLPTGPPRRGPAAQPGNPELTAEVPATSWRP